MCKALATEEGQTGGVTLRVNAADDLVVELRGFEPHTPQRFSDRCQSDRSPR